MMERNLMYLVLLSLVVCLLAVAPVIADPATTPLDLTPPAFVTSNDAAAEAGCTPAFNVSDAGISSYVKVAQAINLNNAVQAFDQILEWDTTHALGEIWISNPYITVKPLVYVDTAGNIVAYYPNKTVASTLISWSGVNLESPAITDFTTNRAIWELCNKTGISYTAIKPGIKYYHFGYPGAQKILIFVNGGAPGVTETTQLMVPASFTQYEASGTLEGSSENPYYPSTLSVDSVEFASTGKQLVFDYGTKLKKGQPHSLTLYNYKDSYRGFSGAVATVIVYTEG